ncbi:MULTISPECIES: hypothetical protein [Cyanophyceae]|uniref:hypothetical protein n=1 Tax=Cyanophyceae TaxID=3028117 RepID=UPI0018EFC210|nr:hypothetical protein [Coleofasciculus sp. FACHB-125]
MNTMLVLATWRGSLPSWWSLPKNSRLRLNVRSLSNLEEELAIVDLLTKPDISLTEKDKLEVKKVALELLSTLKPEELVLD